MSRPRKTAEQRRTEKFCECYRIGKDRIGVTEEELGAIMNLSRPALQRRRENSGKYVSLDDLVNFGKVFGWSDDDFLKIIHAGE